MADEYVSPLRRVRERKRLSLKEVAELLDTSEPQLSKVETGAGAPGKNLEDRLVDWSGLTRDQIAEPRLRRAREPQDKEREPAPVEEGAGA